MVLHHLSNVSRKVYEIGRNTITELYAGKGKNRFQDTPAMLKLWYLTYLLGDRIGENLREPKPKILSIFPYKGINIVKNPAGEREELPALYHRRLE